MHIKPKSSEEDDLNKILGHAPTEERGYSEIEFRWEEKEARELKSSDEMEFRKKRNDIKELKEMPHAWDTDGQDDDKVSLSPDFNIRATDIKTQEFSSPGAAAEVLFSGVREPYKKSIDFIGIDFSGTQLTKNIEFRGINFSGVLLRRSKEFHSIDFIGTPERINIKGKRNF